MTAIGLPAITGQDDAAWGLGEAWETLGVLARAAAQCIRARHELGDGPVGHRAPVVEHGRMDCREATVLCIASRAHTGDDIEAACVLGQSQAPCGCRAIRLPKLRTVGVEAATNL